MSAQLLRCPEPFTVARIIVQRWNNTQDQHRSEDYYNALMRELSRQYGPLVVRLAQQYLIDPCPK